MAAVDIDALAATILAALRVDLGAPLRLDVFDGDVTAVMDGDGRARPYAAFYAGPGNLGAVTLCDTPDVLDWPFQVTAAGGDPTRARRAAHRVRVRLTGAELATAGGVRVRVVEDPDFQPPPIREDRDVTPSRWFTPLQFRASVTTT